MLNCEKKLFIGIDPGMNGGVAFIKPEMQNDYTTVVRCPKTTAEMALALGAGMGTTAPSDIVLFIEHVWAFPGDGKVSAFRFGYNYGLWKGISAAFELDVYNIQPRKWQGIYDMPANMQPRVRKKWLKELAESLFPNIKITYNVSDAVLIANYAKECYFNEEMPDPEKGIGVIE